MVSRERIKPVQKEIHASECETEDGTMKFTTANGVVEFRIPTGDLGIEHFDLLSKAIPQNYIVEPVLNDKGEPTYDKNGDPVEIQVPSPKDIEMYEEARKQWIREILPKVLISPEYDKMRGEDQNICFRVAFESIRVDANQLFRPCK